MNKNKEKRNLKIIGVNFLNSHRHMEGAYNIPSDHVIVDRKDWEETINFLRENETLIHKSLEIKLDEKIIEEYYTNDEKEKDIQLEISFDNEKKWGKIMQFLFGRHYLGLIIFIIFIIINILFIM